jgi:hypothetical protein
MLPCRIDFSLTLLQWPFRLHATLQKLGLVPTSKLLPDPTSYIPFFGSSPIQFLNTPLPILVFFMYQPARMVLGRSLLPLLSFHPHLPREAEDSHRVNKVEKRIPVNDTTGIAHLLQKVSSFFYGYVSLIPKPPSHLDGQILPSGDNAPLHPSHSLDVEDVVAENLAENTLGNIPHAAEQDQFLEDGARSTAVFDQVLNETGLTDSEQALHQTISQSDEDEMDGMSEDRQHNTGSEARIRISSMDMASGTINLQVEIGVAEETVDQALGTSAESEDTGTGRREVAAIAPHKALTFSELAFLPSFIARRWIFRNVASLILLPASTLVLRGLATHYLRTGGFGVTPSLVGTSIGRSVLNTGPLISWTNAQSIGSYVSKVGICLLVRYTLETGVLAINSITVSWIGRTHFGWTQL